MKGIFYRRKLFNILKKQFWFISTVEAIKFIFRPDAYFYQLYLQPWIIETIFIIQLAWK